MNEQDIVNETQQIDDGRRVEAFLADSAVKSAMDKLKSQYFSEFMAAEGVDDTMLVKAKVKVLEDFTVELLKTVHTGIVATRQREKRQKNQSTAGKRQS